jgi:hypothetical protein
MKLWVRVNTKHFQAYLQQAQLANSPETFQRFLREVGTPFLTCEAPSNESTDLLDVPNGSCIRLRTEDQYNAHVQSFQTKQDKSERTTSCTIV